MSDYVTAADLRSRLGINDTADDLELGAACSAASRAIEQHCRRFFGQTAAGTTRTFVADSPYRVRFGAYGDLVSVSAVATDATGDGTFETAWSAGDYQLWPLNPSAGPEVRPYDELRAVGSRTFPVGWTPASRADRVQVTGVWGWPAVPDGVKQAAAILAQDLFKSKDSFGGVAGFGEFGVVRLRQNALVTILIDPYADLYV